MPITSYSFDRPLFGVAGSPRVLTESLSKVFEISPPRSLYTDTIELQQRPTVQEKSHEKKQTHSQKREFEDIVLYLYPLK